MSLIEEQLLRFTVLIFTYHAYLKQTTEASTPLTESTNPIHKVKVSLFLSLEDLMTVVTIEL